MENRCRWLKCPNPYPNAGLRGQGLDRLRHFGIRLMDPCQPSAHHLEVPMIFGPNYSLSHVIIVFVFCSESQLS